MRKTGTFWLFFLLLIPGLKPVLKAQQVRFFISANQISTDDVLKLTVEVSENDKFLFTPVFPKLTGFRSGIPSSENTFSQISGQTVRFMMTYAPRRAGVFRIPAFEYVVDGKRFVSPEFSVQVTQGKGRNNALGPASGGFEGLPEDLFEEDPNSHFQNPDAKTVRYKPVEADYFLSINLNKRQFYIGEEVFCEVMLYVLPEDQEKIQFNQQDIRQLGQRIYNEYFWEEQLDVSGIPMSMARVDGKNYTTYAVYRAILFPLQTGDLRFENIYLDALKQFVPESGSTPSPKWQNIKIFAEDREITVRPLPDQLSAMNPPVGRFRMFASPLRGAQETGVPFDLVLNIRGNGNFATLPSPIFALDSSLQVLHEGSEYKLFKTSASMDGKKEFRYRLLATNPGFVELGPFTLPTFNPETEKADTLTLPSFTVRVLGDSLESQPLDSTGISGFWDRAFAEAGTEKATNSPWEKWLFIAGLGLLVLLWGLRIFMNRKSGKAT